MAGSGANARERVLAIACTLPPAPKVLAGMGRLLRDTNTDLAQVADLIRQDAALAAQVIRISNSVVYGAGQARLGSVEEAVARIGFREIHGLVGCVAADRVVERELSHYGVEAEPLREHLLYTALTCEALAERCGLDPRLAYTAGLLRPLGMLVLDRVAGELGIAAYDAEQAASYAIWEGRVFGMSNPDIAAEVLAEWVFPKEIIDAVREHHFRVDQVGENKLACLLHLACGMVSGTGSGLPGEKQEWDFDTRRFAFLGLDMKDLDLAGRQARKIFENYNLRYRMDAGSARTKVTVQAPPPTPAPVRALVPPPQVSCDSGRPSGVLDVKDENTVQATEEGTAPPIDFTTFMRNYQNMVYTTAVRLLGNEAQAEDISQEVFLKAYEHWENLSTSPTAGGWLKTVTTNLSINHLQRYRKRWRFFSEFVRSDGEEEEAPVEFADPGDFLDDLGKEDRRAWVEQALEKLPEHQRVPLVLFHFEDMPYEDIAKRLGVSLSKVKTDIMRGREALAKVLMQTGASHEKFEY